MNDIWKHPAIPIGVDLAVIIDGDVQIIHTADRQYRRICTLTEAEMTALDRVWNEHKQPEVYQVEAA